MEANLWKREFGVTKVAFDVSMTVIAGVLSFIFSGKLYGVREGTIVAALLVGFIARLIGRTLSFLLDKLFPQEVANTRSKNVDTQKKTICIAIGRQYGSGGHDIGKMIAEELSFDFYDRDMIQMTAGSTGYTPEFIAKHEEKMTNSLLYDLTMQMYAYTSEKAAPDDAIFNAEKKIVMDVAESSNCVIV